MAKPKVLVVDDEKLAREIVMEVLGKEFEVKAAGSGQEAIDSVKNARFDVVLLDIKMPKMSGLEALKEIKLISPFTEVIMTTALDQAEPAWQASKIGAFDYFTKPFDNERLVAKVKEVVDLKKNKDESGRKFELVSELYAKSKLDGKFKDRMNFFSDLFSRRSYDVGRVSIPELEAILNGQLD